jgi:hypothetical protein
MFLRPTPPRTRLIRDPEKDALRCSVVCRNARSFAVFDRTANGSTNRWSRRLVSLLVGLLLGPYYRSTTSLNGLPKRGLTFWSNTAGNGLHFALPIVIGTGQELSFQTSVLLRRAKAKRGLGFGVILAISGTTT